MMDAVTVAVSIGPSLRKVRSQIETMFTEVLADPSAPDCRLRAAMRYASRGGKRLRPLMVKASASLFGVPAQQSLWAGLAAECIHVQSLIHDDLPCMDDDDLRRGSPTVHRAFDEATAVLAGDAFLALAFQLLARPDVHPDGRVRAALIGALAAAVGPSGMAAGQMLDLTADDDRDLQDIMRLQRLKTGALLGWCVEAGAILGDAPAPHRKLLRGYAHCVGLAFQIADDLLDVEGEEAIVGKRLGKDAAMGRRTFVSLMGVERARAQAEFLTAQSIDYLRKIDGDTSLLEAIALFTIKRQH